MKRSGNPGYVDGRAILGGVLEGDAVNVSSDASEWVTVMMGGGVCQVGGARVNVQFREDLRTACILRWALQSHSKSFIEKLIFSRSI